MAEGDLPIDEATMFRVFLLVGLAALPVVALGLLVSPAAAAVLLGFELGIGIGLLCDACAALLLRSASAVDAAREVVDQPLEVLRGQRRFEVGGHDPVR